MVHDCPLVVPERVDKGVLRLGLVDNEGGPGVVPEMKEVADLVLSDERGDVDALRHDRRVVMSDLAS